MGFKDFLKKNEKLYYISYCLSKVNSNRFRNRVLTIRTNPYSVLFDNYGRENPNKSFYDIVVGDETKGFCSAIRDTLYYLLYADALGFVPHIRYTDNIPYHEDHPVNGSENVFEYYFRQPSGITTDELMHSAKVFHAESIHLKGAFQLYGLTQPVQYYSNDQKAIDICSKMYGKFIRLNDDVEKQLTVDMSNLMSDVSSGKKIVGVHYRGTDFKVGYNGHPIAVAFQRHIDETTNLLKSGNYDYVFLATEDGDVISEFQKVFGESLLLYKDVVRGTGETNAYNVRSERANHHYLLGYEVLRDVYTLAVCDAFVSSMSGVGITAQIVKKAKDENFEEVVMLDAGINKSNKILQKNKY